MAITSYSTLKTAIADYTHRSDLTSYLDDFIDQTEFDINRKLRISQMETRATATASTEYIQLPTGFLEMRNIQVNTSPVRILEYVTPAVMDRMNIGETTTPRVYTITADQIQVYPNGTSVQFEIDYYKSITPLDSTPNTTNLLLTSSGDFKNMYLYGCLYHAYIFTGKADKATYFEQKFFQAIDEANKESNARKFSGAPLQTRVG